MAQCEFTIIFDISFDCPAVCRKMHISEAVLLLCHHDDDQNYFYDIGYCMTSAMQTP
uniref:Uncharacterized protein n=1 Tax=Arion vulgaris TaxID=1028688 RepID=A0A0B7ATB9_9EUPU